MLHKAAALEHFSSMTPLLAQQGTSKYREDYIRISLSYRNCIFANYSDRKSTMQLRYALQVL